MDKKELINNFAYETANKGYTPEFQQGAAYGYEEALKEADLSVFDSMDSIYSFACVHLAQKTDEELSDIKNAENVDLYVKAIAEGMVNAFMLLGFDFTKIKGLTAEDEEN